MMEGIIHDSLSQANSLNTRAHARMQGKKKALNYNATSFFAVIKHPIKSEWLSIIKRDSISPVWDELFLELKPSEIGRIEIITSDWFKVLEEE